MVDYLIKPAKRFAVLIPGVIIAYVSVRVIFPYLDKRFPVELAILATYGLAAYVLIPGLIRVCRTAFPAQHLPMYCVTPDGFASDPLNVAIIGTRSELIDVMQKAGWYVADDYTPRILVKHIYCTLFNRRYDNGPMSSLYLFGRKQDIAFERRAEAYASRHHVRFWATTYKVEKSISIQGIHWHNRRDQILSDDLLWVGAGSLDAGLALIRHNLQFTHMVHPDTNLEREYIVDGLKKSNLVKKTENLRLHSPYRLNNRALRSHLHSDGYMTIVWPHKKDRV